MDTNNNCLCRHYLIIVDCVRLIVPLRSNHDSVFPAGLVVTLLKSVLYVFCSTFSCLILKHRGIICGPVADGYESRTIPNDLKEDHDNRRNQQVYSASPVKTVDKTNDSGMRLKMYSFFFFLCVMAFIYFIVSIRQFHLPPAVSQIHKAINNFFLISACHTEKIYSEMYEISPYATFSVAGGRTTSSTTKTPTRGVTTSTLDYTMQFKTFGHPEGDNLNATAYPVLPNPGFGHVKGKSSWHQQRYYNTDGKDFLQPYFRYYK